MEVRKVSKHIEDLILATKKKSSKIEYYDIKIEAPDHMEPGSKLEEKYLKHLKEKYFNEKKED